MNFFSRLCRHFGFTQILVFLIVPFMEFAVFPNVDLSEPSYTELLKHILVGTAVSFSFSALLALFGRKKSPSGVQFLVEVPGDIVVLRFRDQFPKLRKVGYNKYITQKGSKGFVLKIETNSKAHTKITLRKNNPFSALLPNQEINFTRIAYSPTLAEQTKDVKQKPPTK